MEPFNTPERPDYLIELSLRQSDGPKSDLLVLALQELLAQAVRDAADEPVVVDESCLLPPSDPEAVALARKVEARLEHHIDQQSTANPQKQEDYRRLAATPDGLEALRRRQQEAERKVREVVARLMQKGVLALESKVTENAELPPK